MEAFSQFFLGYFNADMTYQDDLRVSVLRNLSSVSGFWFDCVTSIPWSYLDMHFYLVLSPFPAHVFAFLAHTAPGLLCLQIGARPVSLWTRRTASTAAARRPRTTTPGSFGSSRFFAFFE